MPTMQNVNLQTSNKLKPECTQGRGLTSYTLKSLPRIGWKKTSMLTAKV